MERLDGLLLMFVLRQLHDCVVVFVKSLKMVSIEETETLDKIKHLVNII
jgi:hypothetical protein